MNHIDTLKEMRDNRTMRIQDKDRAVNLKPERDALDAAIQALEMLEASSSIYFGNDYICRFRHNPPEYGLYTKGEAGYGDYSSYFEAFAALQEKQV